MDHNSYISFELHDQIEEAVAAGYLEKPSPEYGIAQKVIHGNYDELSYKQRWLFEYHVLRALKSIESDSENKHRQAETQRLVENDLN